MSCRRSPGSGVIPRGRQRRPDPRWGGYGQPGRRPARRLRRSSSRTRDDPVPMGGMPAPPPRGRPGGPRRRRRSRRCRGGVAECPTAQRTPVRRYGRTAPPVRRRGIRVHPRRRPCRLERQRKEEEDRGRRRPAHLGQGEDPRPAPGAFAGARARGPVRRGRGKHGGHRSGQFFTTAGWNDGRMERRRSGHPATAPPHHTEKDEKPFMCS